MSSANTFVHLHVQTEYSLSNSVLRIQGLMSAASERGMAAVAMTDRCNIYAAVKFFKSAVQHGIKPIVGVDLPILGADQQGRTHRLTLLTMNRNGYRNLCELVTEAYLTQREHGVPAVPRESLSGRTEGLIALSGAREGELGQALAGGTNRRRLDELLSAYTNLFPDRFYVELRRVGLPGRKNTTKRPSTPPGPVACRWSRPTQCSSSTRRSTPTTRSGCASMTGGS